MCLSCTVMEMWRVKDNGVTPLTFWSHVTSSVTCPFDSQGPSFYGWSIVTMHPPGTVTEIWRLKDNGVTTSTFWGHVTSSVTWPFDFRGSTFYGWSIVTMRLSCTVMEICGRKMEKGKGKGKEKGKGKGRWKEDSLRNVGCIDARTQRWFYTLSNAMHCIGQTITNCLFRLMLLIVSIFMCYRNMSQTVSLSNLKRNFASAFARSPSQTEDAADRCKRLYINNVINSPVLWSDYSARSIHLIFFSVSALVLLFITFLRLNQFIPSFSLFRDAGL